MNSNDDKPYLPIWCEDCNQQGYIFVNDAEKSYFVICKTCQHETSQVWCAKCQMGGEFVKNIRGRSSSWVCPGCKTRYELSGEFYENPIDLILEEKLPIDTQNRIRNEVSSKGLISSKQRSDAYMAIIIVVAGLIGPWILMWKLLDYIPKAEKPLGYFVVLLLWFVWLFMWRYLVLTVSAKIRERRSRRNTE